MAYEQSWYDVSYNFAITQAGGNITRRIKAPRSGRFVEAFVDTTTTWAGTTPGTVQVGVSGALAKFASVSLVAEAGTPLVASVDGTVDRSTGTFKAGDTILVTFTAPTGGTPAGAANLIVNVAFD